MALKIFGQTYQVDVKVLKTAAHETFLFLGGDFEVNLRLVSEKQIRKLNKTFRGKDAVTNVLSFKLDNLANGGDVAICYREAVREGDEWQMPLSHVTALLLVHGMLHLADYKHTKTEDRAKMEAAEKQIMAKIGVKIER